MSQAPTHTIMGIVNVTPDSFSDGGRYLDPRAAIEHGVELAAEGAEILDVGGESTRPGAEPVGVREELARVLPVIEGLVERLPGVRISIDTAKAQVAGEALAVGASLVNDVSAFRADPDMAAVVAASGAQCCLMHMLGEPRTMQRGVGGDTYEDVVAEVRAFLVERMAHAVAAGVAEERILVDPGIGFGKTAAHNLELLARLEEIVAIGRPVLVGTSRKSFLGRLAPGEPGPDDRLPGTIATNVIAFERGAKVFRVHDVAPLRDALAVTAATLGGRWRQTAERATATS